MSRPICCSLSQEVVSQTKCQEPVPDAVGSDSLDADRCAHSAEPSQVITTENRNINLKGCSLHSLSSTYCVIKNLRYTTRSVATKGTDK
jgi:hypothetical protein